jgi:hypothetical protein
MDTGPSPEEMLKRAAEVCRAVHSYRVVETQYHEAGARRGEEKEERIRAGGDEYRRRLDADDAEESLDFRGETYLRGPEGEWEKMTLVALASLTIDEADSEATDLSDPIDGGLFTIFDAAKVERLPDQQIGDRLFISFEEVLDSGMSPSDPDDRDYSAKMIQRLWFSADDLLLHRHECFMENFYQARMTGRTRQISEYFDINTAVLPSPLPEA